MKKKQPAAPTKKEATPPPAAPSKKKEAQKPAAVPAAPAKTNGKSKAAAPAPPVKETKKAAPATPKAAEPTLKFVPEDYKQGSKQFAKDHPELAAFFAKMEKAGYTNFQMNLGMAAKARPSKRLVINYKYNAPSTWKD